LEEVSFLDEGSQGMQGFECGDEHHTKEIQRRYGGGGASDELWTLLLVQHRLQVFRTEIVLPVLIFPTEIVLAVFDISY
jgi:hypothetical protein